ncbi:(d)CMP kinase [Mycoplasmopsis gallinarum]|uniref:Cytidylate kinase n=1 Tax=Mycoplasmopsis gallinarum TaxID=29557 RepID=A0A168RLF8_9BACT|nr:(d)CMP kinase [Mycoplasmopsis gallinarum]OAB49092.1 Cytidylate kinase [Mycoplasmopsis gallinarum]
MKKINIAIDGPSGAGKSTVAAEIAHRLKYTFINTGSFYRLVAYNALKQNVDVLNEKQVDSILIPDIISIHTDGNLILNNEIINPEVLRDDVISKAASTIAKYKLVRQYVVDIIQHITKKGKGYIMDGRDTTFKIMPYAEVKIFLTAKPEERARRRQLDNAKLGYEQNYEQVLKDVLARDFQDMNRANDPLHKVPDATEIDCTNMTFEQVVNQIIEIVNLKVKNEK